MTLFQIANPIAVNWGGYTLLQADLTCPRELISYNWDYFINLAGSMLPRFSVEDMSAKIMANGGGNIVNSGPLSSNMKSRVERLYIMQQSRQAGDK